MIKKGSEVEKILKYIYLEDKPVALREIVDNTGVNYNYANNYL